MNTAANIQLAKATLIDYLRRHKMRCTPERITLLECAMSTNGHFTVDEFAEMLRGRDFHVSLGTIYNTIELLIDCGLLRRLRFGTEKPCYERTQGSSHHHLICTECGAVKEVRLAELSHAIESQDLGRFAPSSYLLIIYGLCASCRRKQAKAQKQKKQQ